MLSAGRQDMVWRARARKQDVIRSAKHGNLLHLASSKSGAKDMLAKSQRVPATAHAAGPGADERVRASGCAAR